MANSQHRPWASGITLILALAAALCAGERVQGLLLNTLQVAGGVLAIALPLGCLLAVLLFKTRVSARRAAAVIVLTMLFVPLHLHAAAWRAGFGALGWATHLSRTHSSVDPLLSGMPAVIWVHASAAVAWVSLIIGAALRFADRNLEEDALLNLSAFKVLLSVSLRIASPGVAVAAGWVSVTVAQEMTVSDLFQVRTFAEEVYTLCSLGMFDPNNTAGVSTTRLVTEFAFGLTTVALLGVVVVGAAGRLLVGAVHHPARSAWLWNPRNRAAASGALWLLLAVLAFVPIGNLMVKAGGQAVREGDAWRREWSLSKAASQLAAAPVRYRRELGQSAKLGAGVASGAVLLGGAIAWRLRRRGVEQSAWLALLALAMTIPGPLIGLTAIRLFNQPSDSWLAPLGWLYDRTLLVPWAVQMLRAVPVVVLLLWPVAQGVPQRVLEAARSMALADGGSPPGRGRPRLRPRGWRLWRFRLQSSPPRCL